MKTSGTLLVASIILILLGGCSGNRFAGYQDFEIVESTPVGTVLDNPDIRDAADVWIEMIGRASASIDLEEFYCSNQPGEALERVINALKTAAARGVKIRLIADSRMATTYPETLDSLGKLQNFSVRTINFGRLAGGIQHAKYFIVDGKELFLGSQNFDWRALTQIHELGVRISMAPAVQPYRDIFELDWKLSETNDPAAIGGYLRHTPPLPSFTVIESSSDTLVYRPTMSPRQLIPDTTTWDETAITRLIDNAKHELVAQVLTYSPAERGGGVYTVIDSALRRAAGRGVSVKLIVADWSIGPPAINFLKSLARVPNIAVKYTSIPEWSGGYIPFGRVEHCKYLVVDGKESWIGTSNWEKSYFYTVRNVGVAVKNGRVAGILRSVFMKSWDGPYAFPVTPDGDYHPREHGERK